MKRKSNSAGKVITGAILALLGTLMIVDGVTFWDLLALIEFWPLLMIAIGLSKLTGDTRKGGVWLIAIGSWLQIMSLGLFGLGWGNAWPLLLVSIGVGTFFEGVLTPSVARHEREVRHGE